MMKINQGTSVSKALFSVSNSVKTGLYNTDLGYILVVEIALKP